MWQSRSRNLAAVRNEWFDLSGRLQVLSMDTVSTEGREQSLQELLPKVRSIEFMPRSNFCILV